MNALRTAAQAVIDNWETGDLAKAVRQLDMALNGTTDGMFDYTVLLLRPDYVADQYGEDTYLTHVRAPSITAAQALAQEECCTGDHGPDGIDDYSNMHPANYAVLIVLEGHHNDIKEVE